MIIELQYENTTVFDTDNLKVMYKRKKSVNKLVTHKHWIFNDYISELDYYKYGLYLSIGEHEYIIYHETEDDRDNDYFRILSALEKEEQE